jgi:uncharacterized repeat protein (TIGR03803 family)
MKTNSIMRYLCALACASGLHVFTASAATETVIYAFKGGNDGAAPYEGSGMIRVGGTLYGTTSAGGRASNCNGGCGTVFSITPAGKETVLYAFKGGRDGAFPTAALIYVKGTLYGTTAAGGGAKACGSGCGTVFSLTPTGKETVLHVFQGGSDDGALPYGRLTHVRGMLYGTTFIAGKYAGRGNGSGGGTVFSITPAGKETLLYSFQGYSDSGALPFAGLIGVNGTLYGTTAVGGGNFGAPCGMIGCGTVFSVTPTGTERALHRFKPDRRRRHIVWNGYVWQQRLRHDFFDHAGRGLFEALYLQVRREWRRA